MTFSLARVVAAVQGALPEGVSEDDLAGFLARHGNTLGRRLFVAEHGREVVVRLGLPKTTGALPGAAFEMGAPVLISAGALWDARRGRFREPGMALMDLDAALDSAGFVAQQQGGYRWTVEQYVELAGVWRWTWWSQMDLCCEPEIAGDRQEVQRRVQQTAGLLGACTALARRWKAAGAFWLQEPTPVLQGWHADDYERSAGLADVVLEGDWPGMVGVGSVCRRCMGGDAGVVGIVDRLDRVLPAHVGLHLFGVKGDGLKALRAHPRIVSVDSQAWGTAARWDAVKDGASCTTERKVEAMRRWYRAQGLALEGASG